ncbi:hypothetical protein EJ02DRAFT_205547 [Clathrospora elynae]|uniref:Uncharacterized protein n=1 Tax=Clathrospora elynae TaxID=706981 RepID=A0A6A5SNR6_9PLEO|nr:hypothetical protein EJ02DRAFT_205547 [Clathrospora elynae]
MVHSITLLVLSWSVVLEFSLGLLLPLSQVIQTSGIHSVEDCVHAIGGIDTGFALTQGNNDALVGPPLMTIRDEPHENSLSPARRISSSTTTALQSSRCLRALVSRSLLSNLGQSPRKCLRRVSLKISICAINAKGSKSKSILSD